MLAQPARGSPAPHPRLLLCATTLDLAAGEEAQHLAAHSPPPFHFSKPLSSPLTPLSLALSLPLSASCSQASSKKTQTSSSLTALPPSDGRARLTGGGVSSWEGDGQVAAALPEKPGLVEVGALSLD